MISLSEELVQISEAGAAAVLATVVEVEAGVHVEPGAKCLVRDGKVAAKRSAMPRVVQAIVEESASRLRAEKSQLVSLNIPQAGGKLEVFFEVMPSPPKLIVVGAGHIAVPLVKIAKVLDFHVTVIDDRLLYANRERFPDADEVLVGDMAQMLKEMTITPSCYIVLITRGHAYDEPCLRVVLPSQAKYIGMIGSRRRIKACFQRFRDEDKISEELIERVYAPIGLDIGTETPAEIALSILGEVIKVRRGGERAFAFRPLSDAKPCEQMSGIIFSDLGQAASFMALDWVQGGFEAMFGVQPFSGDAERSAQGSRGRGRLAAGARADRPA